MPGLNASAHLQSFGWAGPGHPLNPGAYKQKGSRGLAYDPSSAAQTHNTSSSSSYFAAGGNGLIRPLLVSKKSDSLGLGRRAHEPQKGTEWWLKGFEAALASTGNSSREASEGASTPPVVRGGKRGGGGGGGGEEELQRKVNVQAGRFGGLYGFFVRGETVGGTLGGSDDDDDDDEDEDKEEDEEDQGSRGRGTGRAKRRSEVLDSSPSGGDSTAINNNNDQKQSSKTTKTKKRRKKDADMSTADDMATAKDAEADFGHIAAFMSVRDKDAKKRAKATRLRESEQFRVAGEWLEIKGGGRTTTTSSTSSRKNNKKKNNDVTIADVNGEGEDGGEDAAKKSKSRRTVVDADGSERLETKEERRLRRERRRERRAEKG